MERSVGLLLLSAFVVLLSSCVPLAVDGSCLGVVECDCEVTPGGGSTVINCRNRQLNSVPGFRADSLLYTELTLANNNIRALPDSSFSGLNIQRLDLTGNQIQTISMKAFNGIEAGLKELLISFSPNADFPSDAFTGLQSLELLEIRNFGKAVLPSDAFLKLTSLVELRLVNCSLSSLTANNFRGQVAHLERLSLNGNRFTQIPADALSTLPSLKDLDISFNQLTRLAARAFSRFISLQSIIFDGNSLENNIDPGAFSDIAGTLKALSFLSCRLGDRSIEAIRPLSQLTVLNLRLNNIVNIPFDLFQQMNSIHTLILDSNKITSINRLMFQNLSNSLVSLDLHENPLTSIAPDTFTSLTRLEDLELDGVASLRLSEDTFKNTRALKNLSLERTAVGDSVWAAIVTLYNLQILDLSSASISQIPDYAFQYNGRLQAIDLSSNTISSVTQRSLVGLEDSLASLNLNNNQIKSLDRCTFFQFKYFDYSRLGLNGNRLECNCGLLWLFQKAKAINETNPFKFSSLQWTCSSGKRLVQMKEEEFGCGGGGGATDPPCVPVNRTSQSSAAVFPSVSNETTDSVTLYWTVDSAAEQSLTGFTITYRAMTEDISSTATVSVLPAERNRLIAGLSPSHSYQICIEMKAGTEWSRQSKACVMAMTMAAPSGSSLNGSEMSMSSVIGIAIGSAIGGLLLIALIITAVICFSRQKRENEEKKEKELRRHSSATFASFATSNHHHHQQQQQPSSQPQVGFGSKRYTRNKEPKPYYNHGYDLTDSHPNEGGGGRSQPTLSFSQEETDKILALLTAVRSSDGDPRYTTKPYAQHGLKNNAYVNDDVKRNPYENDQRKNSFVENHDYDVIPDSDYYNEPLDSVV